MACAWCGDEHSVERLCEKAQRGKSRRSFLFLTTSAVVGLALAPSLPVSNEVVSLWQWSEYGATFEVHSLTAGQLVAEAWLRAVGEKPEDNIFTDRAFARLLRETP